MVISEKLLYNKVKKGDIKSFEIIFKEYYEKLVEYAFIHLKDLDNAEEIVQDLFYQLWNKKEKLEISTSLKSYLYRSVHNNCLLRLQHESIKRRHENYVRSKDLDYAPEPIDYVKAGELERKIDEIIEGLPERTKTIFIMNRFDGFKYHEIAEKLTISVKTVEANMGKALKALRVNLREYIN